jgi:hypothetical protein
MSDPRRILDGPSTTPFERDLLESWASEQPSPAARARALAIAGVAAGTLAASTVATVAAASTTGAAAGTAAPGAAGAGGAGVAVVAKWGVLLALVIGSAVGGVLVLRSARTADAPPAAVPTSSLATAATAATTAQPGPVITPAPTPPPSDEPKAVSPADLPAAAPAALPATTATTAATSGATATPSFAEEIASFERARAALDAGDADRAIALVDTYERRFPAGTFLQEAEVLRVQALTRKGDSAGARRVGQRFLAAHPTSPHAARIRAILDASAR